MGLAVDFIDELEVVAYAYLGGFGAAQQAVVIAFAASHAVAPVVVGYSGHDYQFDVVDVLNVVARGLFDVE